jgi:methyl-accepting chemotaxis protein
MTLGRRITLSAFGLTAVTVILGGISWYKMAGVQTQVVLLADDSLPGLFAVTNMQAAAKDQRIAMMGHIASSDPSEMTQWETQISESERKLQDSLKAYQSTVTTDRDRQSTSSLAKIQSRLVSAWQEPRTLSRAAKAQEALKAFAVKVGPVAKERQAALDSLAALNKENGDAASVQATAGAKSGILWIQAGLVVALLVSGGVSFLLVSRINKDLNAISAEVLGGAEQVASASSQVSSSSQSLAQGASQQAASLEESSASAHELSATTKKNVEGSRQAVHLMKQVDSHVANANKTLGGMVVSMEGIRSSSEKVSKIMKVIDEIAFQTNILALNAAVEAARAGVAGAGFAVVADEVRNLAQRCAQAAKDTAELIEESINRSNEGRDRLSEVETVIKAITASSTEVVSLLDHVQAESQEQARGVEQVERAMVQMEQVTQQTAANAQEGAAASQELTSQAQTLRTVIGRLQEMVG